MKKNKIITQMTNQIFLIYFRFRYLIIDDINQFEICYLKF